jgi:sugar phosphate isomerase/epimerase
MKPIVAVNTMAFQGFDLPTALREISALGATHVEFCFTAGYVENLSEDYFSEKNAEKLKQMLAHEGLQTTALAGHIDTGKPEAVSAIKRRLTFAKALGAKLVHTNATQKSNADRFFRNMGVLAAFAEKMKMVVALENPGDGQDALVDTGKSGAEIIEKIGSDHVRLNYDPSNVYSYTKGAVKPEEDIHYALPYSVHFHFKDMLKIEDGWLFSEIGRGVVNYPEIFGALTRHTELLPTSIELPKNFQRNPDFSPRKNPSPPDLDEIKAMIDGSMKFIENGLSQSSKLKAES